MGFMCSSVYSTGHIKIIKYPAIASCYFKYEMKSSELYTSINTAMEISRHLSKQ